MRIQQGPLSWFKRDKNIRVDLGSEAELRKVGESFKQGQSAPLSLESHGKAIVGRRRLASADERTTGRSS
jgi:hypothetical protein